MTAWGTIELAVEAMRRGAHDFVLKPWDNRGLVRTLRAQEALRADEARGAGAFERRDLTVARRVQSRLLPQEPPRLETLELAGCCRPAGPVGGDVYDFLDLGAGRAGFLLGDASGRGVSAALLMAHLQASLRSQAVQSWRDPAGVLRAVNGQFFSATAPEHFATLFFACYEEGSRRLRYVNCGHLPPLLLRADGTSARLGPTAPGLGLLQAWDGVERPAAAVHGRGQRGRERGRRGVRRSPPARGAARRRRPARARPARVDPRGARGLRGVRPPGRRDPAGGARPLTTAPPAAALVVARRRGPFEDALPRRP
jgi:sigma-B regulation protein RsbU (phosphoserine phosphatase)